jgi:hypothetical protein
MRRETMKEPKLIEWTLILLSLSILILMVSITMMRQSRERQITRQDVHEIVDSVLIEVYD